VPFFFCDMTHSNPKTESGFDASEQRLAVVPEVNHSPIIEIADQACARLATLSDVKTANRIRRLAECNAWIDLVLALIELEPPHWKLRRLVYDDGEWHCSLSKHLGLPVEIDETVDGRHTILPLAILTALVEARSLARSTLAVPTVPRLQATPHEPMCCDNFI